MERNDSLSPVLLSPLCPSPPRAFDKGMLLPLQLMKVRNLPQWQAVDGNKYLMLQKCIQKAHPRASSAKTRGFHTQLDEGPETP